MKQCETYRLFPLYLPHLHFLLEVEMWAETQMASSPHAIMFVVAS